jgi:hypothetical protein
MVMDEGTPWGREDWGLSISISPWSRVCFMIIDLWKQVVAFWVGSSSWESNKARVDLVIGYTACCFVMSRRGGGERKIPTCLY